MKPLSYFFSGSGSVQPPLVVEVPVMPTAVRPGSVFPSPQKNGNYIGFMSGSNPFTYYFYDKYGTAVATVTPQNIHASCDGFVPHWFWADSVNNQLRLWAYDAGTSPYTFYSAKVNLTAPYTVTYVGSFQATFTSVASYLGTNATGFHCVQRAAQGEGNFSLYFRNQKVVVSDGDGTLISGPTTVTQNGVALTSISDAVFSYITADGEIYMSDYVASASGYTHGPGLLIYRGGSLGVWPFNAGSILPHGDNSSSSQLNYAVISDFVCAYHIYKAYYSYGARCFDRVDFDRFLHECANALGLPQTTS